MSLTPALPGNPALAPQTATRDGLETLVYHVSTLAHADGPLSELVERTGSLVLYTLHADALRIALSDPGAGSSAVFTERRLSPVKDTGAILISRPIAVRGKVYGHLEASIGHSRWPAASLLLALETIIQVLARRAEREQLRAAHSGLREVAATLRDRRHLDVVLTRAAGVVAGTRNWPLARAGEWLRQEAMRQGVPLARIAERLILSTSFQRRLAPSRPGMPLRRTA